jgi:DNA mismatch endonuclease (patch repair protein)
MRANRRVDTAPEIALRAALHARGLRFRKDYPIAVRGGRATRIDVAFTGARVAIFLDGCFWHACPQHGETPNSNTEFWTGKLAANRERDRLVTESLERDGWRVIRIWEHESVQQAANRVAAAVRREDASVSSL